MRRASVVLSLLALAVVAWHAGWLRADAFGQARSPVARDAVGVVAAREPSGLDDVRPVDESGAAAWRGRRLIVRSKGSGAAIAGATVRDGYDAAAAAWTTDECGMATVRGVGEWYVVSAAGYATESVHADRVLVELAQGATVSGVVIDAASNAPVNRASVTLGWDGRCTWQHESMDTAQDGRFRLVAPVCVPFELMVDVEGLEPVVVREVVDAPREGLRVVVGGGGVLEGRVAYANGAAVVGARVFLANPADSRWRSRGAETDSDGRYRLRGIPPDIDLVPTAGYLGYDEGAGEPVRFHGDGEVLSRDICVAHSASLAVSVRLPDGETIDSLGLTLWNGASFEGYPRWLDEDRGHVFVEPPGTYTLWVERWGFSPERREVVLHSDHDTTELVDFSGGHAIEGLVVGPDGLPVESGVLFESEGLSAVTATDAGGRFLLRGLPATPATITADPFDWSHGRAARKDVAPGGAPVVLVVPRAATITGALVGIPAGEECRIKIQTAWLDATSWGTIAVRKELTLFNGHHYRAERSYAPEIGPSGRFELVFHVLDEPAVLSVRVDGMLAPAVVPLAPLRPGEERDLGEIRLDAGRAVRGTVLGPDGRPLFAAKVTVAEPWADESTRTDRCGVFRLFGMPASPLWLRVEAEGFPVHVVRLGEEGGPIRLTNGGIANGRGRVAITPVLDDPALDEDMASVRPAPDAEGAFRARLQPGRYRAFALREERAPLCRERVPVLAEFVVEEGQATTIAAR